MVCLFVFGHFLSCQRLEDEMVLIGKRSSGMAYGAVSRIGSVLDVQGVWLHSGDISGEW